MRQVYIFGGPFPVDSTRKIWRAVVSWLWGNKVALGKHAAGYAGKSNEVGPRKPTLSTLTIMPVLAIPGLVVW